MTSLHVTCTIMCAVLSESFVGSTGNCLREIPHILSCFRRATRTPDHRLIQGPDLGRFRIRSRNQRTNLNPNPDLIPDSESCVVESDLESESCRFESESDSDS